MDGKKSNRLTALGGAAVLACAGLLAACSHAPQEPAPVFALPLSRVVGAPHVEGQEPASPGAQSGLRQLRYVAVPPGHHVAGMARAHVILKQAAAAPHRPAHAHKTKLAGRHHDGRVAAAPKDKTKAAAAPPTGNAPAAMIMLDEPAPANPATPSPTRYH